jgi:hypothetical protein
LLLGRSSARLYTWLYFSALASLDFFAFDFFDLVGFHFVTFLAWSVFTLSLFWLGRFSLPYFFDLVDFHGAPMSIGREGRVSTEAIERQSAKNDPHSSRA